MLKDASTLSVKPLSNGTSSIGLRSLGGIIDAIVGTLLRVHASSLHVLDYGRDTLCIGLACDKLFTMELVTF